MGVMKEIATAKQEAKNYDLFECYLAHLEEVEQSKEDDDPSEDEGVLNEKNSPVV